MFTLSAIVVEPEKGVVQRFLRGYDQKSINLTP